MKTITQTMKFRQALVEYSFKHGVTKAAIRYRVNRQYVYRWRKRYDGSLQSLADRSHKPNYHPNQHTEAELKLILDMRKRNPMSAFKRITGWNLPILLHIQKIRHLHCLNSICTVWAYSTNESSHIHLGTMGKWKEVIEKTMNTSMLLTHSIRLMILQNN